MRKIKSRTTALKAGPEFYSDKRVGAVAGVDEAGRGPLAGPVVAAAVILSPTRPIAGVDDCKRLRPGRRVALAERIAECAVAWGVGWAHVEEIDRVNVLQATLSAMGRAIAQLSVEPDLTLVDGNRCPNLAIPMRAVVRGDQTVLQIAAASIIAKVTRDAHMLELDDQYPQYGFARHKGYPTGCHLAALRQYGASPVHRRSFAPVREVLS